MSRLATVACVVLAVAGVASAATISGTVSEFVAYSRYDISTGVSDWALYGGLGETNVNGFTSKTASSSFSALTIDGTPYSQGLNGYIKFQHEEGVGSYPAAVVDPSSVDAFPVVADSGSLSQISFTHTMQGADETINVIVLAKTNQMKVDITATTASGGSWSWLNQYLPTSGSGNKPQAVISLDVSGATVGEDLTFTITGNYTDLSPSNWWGVGVAGANSTVVPEPTSMALIGLGGIAALLRRRRS